MHYSCLFYIQIYLFNLLIESYCCTVNAVHEIYYYSKFKLMMRKSQWQSFFFFKKRSLQYPLAMNERVDKNMTQWGTHWRWRARQIQVPTVMLGCY